jgi:L-threonylcarbamoyladenylate synthase
VLPKTDAVPDDATAGLPSVAVRMPSHSLFRKLIRLAGVPLAAPSANPFGYVSPTSAAHVIKSLGSNIRHILDGGPSRIGLESTIIDLRDPRRPALLRPGAITQAEVARVLGTPVAASRKTRGRAQVAPGQLARHYSPRTPVTLHARIMPRMMAAAAENEAWLLLARPRVAGKPAKARANVFWLDATGNLARASRRLFAALRELDEAGYKRIHVERAAGGGLAEALTDRLQRAASR